MSEMFVVNTLLLRAPLQLPSPLRGGVGGGGETNNELRMFLTPLPNPPPQGGRENCQRA